MPSKRSIPRTCQQCGQPFMAWRTSPDAKFCSRKCKDDAARTGRNVRPSVPARKKIPRICEQCGVAFLARTQAVNRGGARFCSNECKHAAARTEKVDVTCPQCGKAHRVYPSVARTGGNFCSRSCGTAYNMTGSRHPRWKGGIGRHHETWSVAVKERDHWTCQRCGATDGLMHAHHIKDYDAYPELREDVANGVTLCAKCHRQVHRGDPLTIAPVTSQTSTA